MFVIIFTHMLFNLFLHTEYAISAHRSLRTPGSIKHPDSMIQCEKCQGLTSNLQHHVCFNKPNGALEYCGSCLISLVGALCFMLYGEDPTHATNKALEVFDSDIGYDLIQRTGSRPIVTARTKAVMIKEFIASPIVFAYYLFHTSKLLFLLYILI